MMTKNDISIWKEIEQKKCVCVCKKKQKMVTHQTKLHSIYQQTQMILDGRYYGHDVKMYQESTETQKIIYIL